MAKSQTYWVNIFFIVFGLHGIYGFYLTKISMDTVAFEHKKDPYTAIFRVQNQGNITINDIIYTCEVGGIIPFQKSEATTSIKNQTFKISDAIATVEDVDHVHDTDGPIAYFGPLKYVGVTTFQLYGGRITRKIEPSKFDSLLMCQFLKIRTPQSFLHPENYITVSIHYRPTLFPFTLEDSFKFSLNFDGDDYAWTPMSRNQFGPRDSDFIKTSQ